MPGTLQAEAVGPVDVAVIVFGDGQVDGDVALSVRELSDSGVVHIIDLSFVSKDADGVISVVEAADAKVADAFESLTGSQFDLLSDEDLDDIGGELPLGSVALVVVWENTWAARFASAVRRSHGEVVGLERVPRETVLAAIAALDED
jgi:Family of unknown function (DUF6325)